MAGYRQYRLFTCLSPNHLSLESQSTTWFLRLYKGECGWPIHPVPRPRYLTLMVGYTGLLAAPNQNSTRPDWYRGRALWHDTPDIFGGCSNRLLILLIYEVANWETSSARYLCVRSFKFTQSRTLITKSSNSGNADVDKKHSLTDTKVSLWRLRRSSYWRSLWEPTPGVYSGYPINLMIFDRTQGLSCCHWSLTSLLIEAHAPSLVLNAAHWCSRVAVLIHSTSLSRLIIALKILLEATHEGGQY